MTHHPRSVIASFCGILLSAIVSAQCGGSTTAPSAPAPAVPVIVAPAAASAALSSISFSVLSVVGGNSVVGTATLTAAAPVGGASVTLTGGSTTTVPATILVAAGSSSGTFTVFTRSVDGTVENTISGSYGGGSASAVLSVTRTTIAIASFGVTGATESDTCSLSNGGNALVCTFDGNTSSAPGTIVAWDWTFAVAGTFANSTTGPVLTQPPTSCTLLPDPALPHEFAWFPMTVTLTVRDSLGNVSATAINRGTRVFPNGMCGF